MSERKLLLLMNAEQAQAFAGLVAAANAGDGGAACRLGDLYREGLEGLRYSPKQAYRWYAKSALTGDANGQNNLGACCEHGLGCVQSYAKAAKWYRLAAAQGLAYASSNLGYLYLRGHGVPADSSTALGWFEKALAQGDERAEQEIAKLKSAAGPRVSQPVPAGTPLTLPWGLARRVPRRDGPQEQLRHPETATIHRNNDPHEFLAPPNASDRPSCDGPPVQLRHPQVANDEIADGTCGLESRVVEHPADRPGASRKADQQSADRESARPRIRYLGPADVGKNFGIVGTGGVRPPRPAPWEDEDLRVELLNVLRSEEVGGEVEQNNTGEASEAELFPIYAACGMVPGDFEKETARRYEEYLKWRKQE